MGVEFKEQVWNRKAFSLIPRVGLVSVTRELLYSVQYKKGLLIKQVNRSVIIGINFSYSFLNPIYTFILHNIK